MRVRTTLLSLGLAALTVTGMSAPAQAATWTHIGAYPTKSACVNAGLSYQRQGWDAFKCVLIAGSQVDLWVK
ncbi:hypothetical protein AB0F17_46225 [Nonomuraea sp. NPDC026600]|uniref:hypothetical protein n=1 Tax=Nonomuraea sp. NPDC026600 TaxID=3155363 RepID=UPI003411B577